MLVDSADFVLWMSLAMSLTHITGFWGNKIYARSAAITLFLAISYCFGALIYSFVISDFSLKIVYQNSHTLKPMLYKISGTWGNHEGSLLMLIWVIAAYGFAYTLGNFNPKTVAVQGLISFLFILFLKLTSNPFERLPVVMPDGIGLNPLLQDVGLAFHPPMLYLGYVGFALVYSLSFACLITGKLDKVVLKQMRFWCLVSWSFLTIGIGLGSWWAYRELGWGGFWFWDPVENSSLMPWLSGAALFHSLMVTEKRKALQKWAVLLSIITFALSLVGFFLTRSGVLNSVHSFANDPSRGMFMIGILVVILGSALTAFAIRGHKLTGQGSYDLLSRETGIMLNNLILSVLCLIVFLGTIYPIITEMFLERSISVGAPYFNKTFLPISIGLIYLCAIASGGEWKKNDLGKLAYKLVIPEIIALVPAVLLYTLHDYSLLEASAVFVSIFLVGATVQRFKSKAVAAEIPMLVSHFGVAVIAVGILYAAGFEVKEEKMMRIGDKVSLSSYEVTLKEVTQGAGENYIYRRGIFDIWRGDIEIGQLAPEMRLYPVEQQTTNESSIMKVGLISDIYLVIGEKNKTEQYAVRAYYKPAVNLIWLGFALIAAGSFVSVLRKLFAR